MCMYLFLSSFLHQESSDFTLSHSFHRDPDADRSLKSDSSIRPRDGALQLGLLVNSLERGHLFNAQLKIEEADVVAKVLRAARLHREARAGLREPAQRHLKPCLAVPPPNLGAELLGVGRVAREARESAIPQRRPGLDVDAAPRVGRDDAAVVVSHAERELVDDRPSRLLGRTHNVQLSRPKVAHGEAADEARRLHLLERPPLSSYAGVAWAGVV
mmetsp:Transcript_6900/g.22597  ORF Transcript_6900/g.22597 Transcript_6900/m.22597 type:complete len:215 (+) Transcript_6900:507-1151(+)